MTSKSEHCKKIVLAVVLISFPVFLLMWLVGPRKDNEISIRVLFVSYAGDTVSAGMPSVTVLSSQKNSAVVIDGNEWDLPTEPQDFYRNNIVLECTSNAFPVHWGFTQRLEDSRPSMTIYSSRVIASFSDQTSYQFVSTVNLMPYKETSTGKYICDNINTTIKNASKAENYFYIYFTGKELFLSNKSISIESKNGKELNIPCPISNPEISISLYREQGEEEILLSAPNESYTNYDPQDGFTLSTKFLEEKDPWGRYICRATDDPRLHSEYIDITPPKDYLVNVIPANSTVYLNEEHFDGKFLCEAKESISLQLSKIRKFRIVSYKMNESSDFPYTARVQYELKDLREYSSITCKTDTGNILHTWRFATSMAEISMGFQYDEKANEFSCCSQNSIKMRPNLQILDCASPSECAVRQSCFENDECTTSNKNIEDMRDCKILAVSQPASGMLECSVGSGVQRLYYFFNGVRLFADKSASYFYDLPAKEIMMVATYPKAVNNTFYLNVNYKFICKGSRFVLAGGFIWFIRKLDGSRSEVRGKGYFDQNWVYNSIEVVSSNYEIKEISCIAPVLNSPTQWKKVTLEINYGK